MKKPSPGGEGQGLVLFSVGHACVEADAQASTATVTLV
jgi:hypothetical protein